MKVDQKWIDGRVKELVRDAEYYIEQGFSTRRAIEIVRKETAFSKQIFQRVVNLLEA